MADNIVIRLQIFLSFHVDSLYKKPRFCFFVFLGGGLVLCLLLLLLFFFFFLFLCSVI